MSTKENIVSAIIAIPVSFFIFNYMKNSAQQHDRQRRDSARQHREVVQNRIEEYQKIHKDMNAKTVRLEKLEFYNDATVINGDTFILSPVGQTGIYFDADGNIKVVDGIPERKEEKTLQQFEGNFSGSSSVGGVSLGPLFGGSGRIHGKMSMHEVPTGAPNVDSGLAEGARYGVDKVRSVYQKTEDSIPKFDHSTYYKAYSKDLRSRGPDDENLRMYLMKDAAKWIMFNSDAVLFSQRAVPYEVVCPVKGATLKNNN